MDIREFKKLISRSNTKKFFVGLFILLFGAFLLWLVLSGADSEMKEMSGIGMVVLWALVVICLFIGGLIMLQPIRTYWMIKTANHPIINAIENSEEDVVVWMYQHTTSVKGGGSDHRLWIHTKDGKQHSLALSEHKVQKALAYLSEQFPRAKLGYSEEIKKEMKQRLN